MEQAEGVTQGSDAPQVEAQDSAPESIVSGDTQANEEGKTLTEGEPQPKSKEYNFKQMRATIGKFEAEKKQWESERQQLKNASILDNALRTDPKGALKQIAKSLGISPKDLFDELAEASKQGSLPKVNFEQYDPETGALLKGYQSEIEALKQWKDEFSKSQAQREQESQNRYVEQNMKTIDKLFNDNLVKDGFMNDKGESDKAVIELIEDAIVAKLAKHGDPRFATSEQYQEAYRLVTEGLKNHQKQTLKNTVTKSAPPTGSRQGQATTAKTPMTREQRIAELANSAKAMFGFE